MSDIKNLTSDPVQITDGSNGAHITTLIGAVMYADSASSSYWHMLRSDVLEIRPPTVIYIKAKSPGGASIVVTTWSES